MAIIRKPLIMRPDGQRQELSPSDCMVNEAVNYIRHNQAVQGLGDWVVYADAAADVPVDGTGGSSTCTFAINTISPLSGTSDYKFSKPASNCQGQGFSYPLTIDKADRFKTHKLSFDYEIPSLDYAFGDLRVFLLDTTNNILQDVSFKEINKNSGTFELTFPFTGGSLNYRLIIHVATVSALAFDIFTSNWKFAPTQNLDAAIVTDWTPYTATFSGFGVVTGASFQYRRVGSSLEIEGVWTNGTVAASEARVTLPTGLLVDSSLSSRRLVGSMAGGGFAGSFGVGVTAIAGLDYVTFSGGMLSGSNALTALNANAFSANAGLCTLRASIRIAGWNSGGYQYNSTSFKISSWLVNGTRVTGAQPSTLGQYRTYRRNASANTYIETSATPGTAPSLASGMIIHGNVGGWATADPVTQPTRYDIFVGRNKSIQWEFYSGINRTGGVSVDDRLNGTLQIGCRTTYDPSTGIATITSQASATATQNVCGLGPDLTAINNVYFDIIVSDNPLPMQITSLRSELVLRTGLNFGTTNTQVRGYSVVDRQSGGDLQHIYSAANGSMIRILSDGIYSFSATDFASGVTGVGITRGFTTLSSTSYDQMLAYQGAPANSTVSVYCPGLFCQAGSQIRVCSDVPGSITGNSPLARFRATKVGY